MLIVNNFIRCKRCFVKLNPQSSRIQKLNNNTCVPLFYYTMLELSNPSPIFQWKGSMLAGSAPKGLSESQLRPTKETPSSQNNTNNYIINTNNSNISCNNNNNITNNNDNITTNNNRNDDQQQLQHQHQHQQHQHKQQ